MVLLIAGCAGNISFGGGTGACGVRAHNVHASRGTPGDMGGKAIIQCTVDVTDVRLEVRLEKQLGSTWSPVTSNLDLMGEYGPVVGALPLDKTATRQVFIPCELGTVRLAARGSAALNGVPAKSAAWQYSGPTTNPCDGS